MFRTIRDLFWRPGYMIRDYLGGHHLSYFPPFKMLAVLTIFIFMLAYIFHAQDNSVETPIAESLDNVHLSKGTQTLLGGIKTALLYLEKNDLYRILVQNVFVVLAAWIVFRKKGYNLVETAFSQIYINCQFHVITIVWLLFAWTMPPTTFFPYSVPSDVAFVMLVYDYKQLYGLTIKKSIWKTILFLIITITLYVLTFLLVMVIIGAFEWLFTSSALDGINKAVASAPNVK